jgi:hypothetical protein
MIAEHLRPATKTWGHDRSETVGASEIGQCARQTWYSKHGYAPEGEQSWGPAERGHMIEAWVTAKLGAVMELTRVQQTLFDGPLSATLDMVIPVEMPLDVKSFDPRTADPLKPKHLMQLQVQMGMIEAHQGMLLYVNAADFSDVRACGRASVSGARSRRSARALCRAARGPSAGMPSPSSKHCKRRPRSAAH